MVGENPLNRNGKEKDIVSTYYESSRRYNRAYELRHMCKINVREFYDNFEEIMTYYKGKRKQKADLIDSLIADKDLVWTSKIPVYSTVLRPQGITTES